MKSLICSLPWFALLLHACTERAEPNFRERRTEGSSAELASLDAASTVATSVTSVDASRADAELVNAASTNELGWPAFNRRDDVPVCLFADSDQWWSAKFLKDVKKSVSLRADRELVLGTYAPGCASKECVLEPTLQCWVDVDGKVLTVHTKYSGWRHADRKCSSECESVTAECETAALAAGTYTLVYGARKKTVRIPSVVRPACFGL
jgi:hypothetical protein